MAQHLRLSRQVAAHTQQVVVLSVWAALVAAMLTHDHADAGQVSNRHRLALGTLTLTLGHVISSTQ